MLKQLLIAALLVQNRTSLFPQNARQWEFHACIPCSDFFIDDFDVVKFNSTHESEDECDLFLPAIMMISKSPPAAQGN